MTIVVTTPTGQVGSRVVRLLTQAGARPRVLLRDPARLSPGTEANVEVRTGDLTDPDYVRRSLRDTDTVLWIDPTPHTVDDPSAASLRTARPLIEAAQRGDCARVVLLSSVGAELRHGAGHIDALGGIEEQLNATGADVVHLRAGYFFTNLLLDLDGIAAGMLPTAFHPDRPMAWVAPRDIGDVAAARLLRRDWSGKLVQGVHGPRDLSFNDVAEILGTVLGKRIRVEPVDDAELRRSLRSAGLPAGAVAAIAGMPAGTRDLRPEQPREYLTTTPTTLEEWCYGTLRPLLRA